MTTATRRAWTAADLATLARWARGEITTREASGATGRDSEALRRGAANRGMARVNHKRVEAHAPTRARIVALVAAGLTSAAIARELGVTRDTIRAARRRLGLAPPPSQAPPRGAAARLAPVPPCSRCGTDGGYTPRGRARPERRDGSPFGYGPICKACRELLYARTARGLTPAEARSAPPRDQSAGSRDGWEARYRAVRAEVLSRCGGYEPDDRDPLAGPWRVEQAGPDPGAPRAGRSAAACAELLGAWRMGPRALARAAFAARGG